MYSLSSTAFNNFVKLNNRQSCGVFCFRSSPSPPRAAGRFSCVLTEQFCHRVCHRTKSFHFSTLCCFICVFCCLLLCLATINRIILFAWEALPFQCQPCSHAVTHTAPPRTFETTPRLSKETFTFVYLTPTPTSWPAYWFCHTIPWVISQSPLKAVTFQNTSGATVLEINCILELFKDHQSSCINEVKELVAPSFVQAPHRFHEII